MSEKLTTYFEKQPLIGVEKSLNSLREQIHPDFMGQFDDYRTRLLGILSNNTKVANDPIVQQAVAKANNKIEKAMSGDNISSQIRQAITEASDTSWQKAA